MRLKNIFRNSFFSILSQCVVIVFGFFSQRVMFLRLGQELVGMNGVIANIIAILSVSELGIATAVVYHLYRALARQDEQEIAALMNLYRKAYLLFAAAITVLGLAVLPFVHRFLTDSHYPVGYVRLIYSMWLLRTVLSYLLSYKRSILIADQKEYLVSIVTLFTNVMDYLAIILIVGGTENYVAALGANIIIEVLWNAGLSYYVGRAYPFLRGLSREPLPRDILHAIISDVKNIFVTRLSAKLLYSTDNLIISKAISVGIVGAYSNYSLIIQAVTNLVLALSNAIQPSIGNLFVEEDQEKNYQVLRRLTFVFFLIAAFVGTSLLSLMEPFIGDLWLGERSVLQPAVAVCCAAVCSIQTLGLPVAAMMGVTGLFEKERDLSVVTAMVNLVVSLLLAKSLGIEGVLIGTCVSYVVQMAFRIRIFFSEYLERSSRRYVLELLEYLGLAAVQMAGIRYVTGQVYASGGIFRFLLIMCLCGILPFACNGLLFCRTERMRGLWQMVSGLRRH